MPLALIVDLLRSQCSYQCFVDGRLKDRQDQFHYNTPADRILPWPLGTPYMLASSVHSYTQRYNDLHCVFKSNFIALLGHEK